MPHRLLPQHRFAVAALSAIALAAASCKPPETGAAPTPAPSAVASSAGFSTNPYCPPGVVLCSALPGDIQVPPGCDPSDQQCSRDYWSWQSFVSLNWPGVVTGVDKMVRPDPRQPVTGPGSRVWELWMDPDAVFLPNAVTPVWTPDQSPPQPCAAGSSGKAMVGRLAKASVDLGKVDPNDFFEATINQPLIDQNLEFVLFEIRMSQSEVGWVVTNNLYQQEAVNALQTSLQFPADAIEAKAAWRILPATMQPAQKARYYREAATIVLDPQHVEGGGTGPVCINRELGLVALHIRSGRNGLWSTFEQVDNVTANAGFPPTFNNPACPTCKVNFPPTYPGGRPIFSDEYKWKLNGPSAGLYKGFPNVPAQITRAPGEDAIIDKDLNAWWQQSVLKGTVWANYMLITTNWIEFPVASQPIPALNTALEPYIPAATQYPQACIECHKLAVNDKYKAALGQSFMPFRACPKKPVPGQPLPPNCVLGTIDTLAAHD